MVEIRREVSPDGLALVVERDGQDIIIGFDDAAWHTHPDLFERFDGDLERTAMAIVEDVIAGRMLLTQQEGPDGFHWALLGNIELELSPQRAGEALTIRNWAGAAIDPADLASGRVTYVPAQ